MTTSSSKWDRTKEMAEAYDDGASLWLKLANDGDRAILVFLGDPHPREVVFVDGRYQPFSEDHAARGLKPSLRVAYNVAVVGEPGAGPEVKIFEQGVVFFKQLLQLREKRPLEQWIFEVERHGAAGSPKTKYSILPERELSAHERAAIQALQLHDLETIYSGQGGGAPPTSPNTSPASVAPPATTGPIPAEQALALIQRLKFLPPAMVDRFCAQFSVTRIRELPAHRLDEALAFVAALEAEARPAARAEVNPFD